ncbi:hypothetical protein KC19_6G108300 [Ceratodon purpureus]|uniref:glutathione transferase n=1 Tax=Ceratodon purpureus TaxID=3225 RepID=A0A8T0HD49_CERPU|nr:hypothetical protein KC19_6G108300 [Ceratodon purpureus]
MAEHALSLSNMHPKLICISPSSWEFEGRFGERSGIGEGELNGSTTSVPSLQVQAGIVNLKKPRIEVSLVVFIISVLGYGMKCAYSKARLMVVLWLQIFGVVPYLEDGDLAVFESRAIAKYFAEKYDVKCNLLGKTLKERAIINTWMESEAHNFNPAVAPMIKELFLSMVFKKPANQELISTSLTNLNSVLDVYEIHLSKNKYLAGENYTLADANHTPYMEKVRTMDVFKGILDSRPHLAAWVADITSLPAFKKCMQMDWDKATPFE